MFSVSNAQAVVLTEDFEGDFPAWETNWFGVNSTANNYYCFARGCTDRGNNPDGLWVVGGTGVEVSFVSAFAASLASFKLDVAGYSPTTLRAFDTSDNLIFSQDVTLTSGAFSDPGVYESYTITSTNGISRFIFSGGAAGNTSIDNLVATTDVSPIPEPETYALMLAGLAALGVAARRRKAA
jgi:hypothetical protein